MMNTLTASKAQSQQKTNPSSHWLLTVINAAINAAWKILMPSLDPVITHRQSAGEDYWTVYDPVSRRKRIFFSEAELRSWLEKRYYES